MLTSWMVTLRWKINLYTSKRRLRYYPLTKESDERQ
jgi:hypothetical protein